MAQVASVLRAFILIFIVVLLARQHARVVLEQRPMPVYPALTLLSSLGQLVDVRLIIIPIQMQVSVLNVTPRVIIAVEELKTTVQNATLLLHLMVAFAHVLYLTSLTLLRKAVRNVTLSAKVAVELQIISVYPASLPQF